jgi:SAM-dependent methyltransferase
VRLATRYSYLGVEPDETSAAMARRRLERFGIAGEVRLGDISAVADDERFDFVCAFEVVEHIKDDAGFIRECVGRLRPGGVLMLTTPAGAARFGASDELVGHFRRYDPDELGALLAGAGLELVELRRYGAPLGNALERVWEALAIAKRTDAQALSIAERTARSGRLRQPNDGVMAIGTWAATLPARKLQLAMSGRGPSLLGVARLPATAPYD